MKVIVAGPPKTGTTSMALALRQLGYSVYDSPEQMTLLQTEWYNILINGHTPDFRQMFKGVDALTDGPGYYFWKQLLQVFPNAKVILLLRDEDSWAKSYKHQKEVEDANRWMSWFSPNFRRVYEVADAVEKLSMGSEKFVEYLYRWKLRLHNERVRAVVPKDQLLEFEIGDGWESLCKFLGKEVPQMAYPHANKNAGDFEEEFRKQRKQKLFTITAMLTCLFAVLLAVLFGRNAKEF